MDKKLEKPELRVFKYDHAIMADDFFDAWFDYELQKKPELEAELNKCKEALKDAFGDGFMYGNEDANEDTEENIRNYLRMRPEINRRKFNELFYGFDGLDNDIKEMFLDELEP